MPPTFPLHCDNELQNFPFVINRAPEIPELAVDLHKNFVQMPPPLGVAAHARNALLPDLRGKHGTKMVPPESDGLMADVDSAFVQGVFHIAQRQRILPTHHYHQTDDLR